MDGSGKHLEPPLGCSVAEAARMIGISRSSVYNALKDGRIRSRKFGRRTLLERDEVLRFWKVLADQAGH